ncbi:unnamed protein product [Moneuplotes crassus]|uniref:non-specific serine/threonine protein kinase n=1 Tax=Euplotes crassus TaxID=5936 RepID=A0AAD1Y1T1_EUPCR|nr:unnamed protein product [Moneuplotes crassus]
MKSGANSTGAKTIDQFKVLAELNTGCFGRVSKIEEIETGEILVWKEINYKNIDKKQQKLIITEVNIMRSLDDDNVVKYKYRINDKTKEKLYIVMEFCEKGDLKQFLDKRKRSKEPIQEDSIWNLCTQMLLALNACHKNKERVIIHRDLKPGNIFIDRFGQFKLGDFGLSKELSENSVCAKTNLGTPYYMSPEQVKGNEYDQKCDIWALGCIIHEMAALDVPFRAENYLRLAEVISKGEKSPIPERYSEDLHKLIDLMMRKDPKIRPSASKLLTHPKISECLTRINLKKRMDLKVEREEFLKRQKELFKKEQLLRKKERELERLNKKYLKRVKELNEHEKQLERKHSALENMTLNSDISKNFTQNEGQRLNKTVDQTQEMSALKASHDRQIDTSVKLERMSYDFKENDQNKENINISNRNLLSSTSSFPGNNCRNVSSNESKVFTSPHNYDDSQRDAQNSSKRSGKMRCELFSKNVSINLCNEENSNDSRSSYKTKEGTTYFHSNSRDKTGSLTTGDTSIMVRSNAKNALESHMAAKERYCDTSTFSATRGLPPSGQKQVTRTSLDILKQGELNDDNTPEGATNLSRNFSTNFLRIANIAEGNRNRASNQKTIAASFRTNSVENLHARQHMQGGNLTFRKNLAPSNLANMKVGSSLTFKKSSNISITKPPMRNNLSNTGMDPSILKKFQKMKSGSKNSVIRKNFNTSSSTKNLKVVSTSSSARAGFISKGRYQLTNLESNNTPKEAMGHTFEINNSLSRDQKAEDLQRVDYRRVKDFNDHNKAKDDCLYYNNNKFCQPHCEANDYYRKEQRNQLFQRRLSSNCQKS